MSSVQGLELRVPSGSCCARSVLGLCLCSWKAAGAGLLSEAGQLCFAVPWPRSLLKVEKKNLKALSAFERQGEREINLSVGSLPKWLQWEGVGPG